MMGAPTLSRGSIQAPPRPGALLEALRGLGYSTATALADIIDNSIAAGADQVDVTFGWRGHDSFIAVLDNGTGMDRAALERAMKIGEIDPLAQRSAGDLGRFGLGLKTASFSQGRRLTVATSIENVRSCLCWDLDVLAASRDGGWHLLEGPSPGSQGLLEPLRSLDHGTIVVWENLDRIITPGFSQQDFLELIDLVERHLAAVFHRMLTGVPALRLRINGRKVGAWDPFLLDHVATWSSPIERIESSDGAVELQCHVLPHQDRLERQEREEAAGANGWVAQQGFYLYRNLRLLVGGSWLGLGRGRPWTREEAYRLARLRVDISNAADAAWKIDIRKSTARPPVSLRDRLTRIAEDTRERARRVFAHRGQPTRPAGRVGQVAQATWRAEHFAGGVRYRIDEEHPAVKAVLEDAGALEPQLRAMLRVLEETIPVQRIWLDTAEARETPRNRFAGQEPAAISAVLQVMYRNLTQRKGMSPAVAREHLLRTEPFDSHPALVAALGDEASRQV
jgi:hypothetical protein